VIEFAFDLVISDAVAIVSLRGEADIAAAEQVSGAGSG
jgi:hypothetical protein